MSTVKKYVYDFKSYKDYLLWILGGRQIRRGEKARMAEVAECQPTYLSQVLHGKAHLSLEQSLRISQYLKHTPDESNYFMLLVNLGRAGTEDLKHFYQSQIKQIIRGRSQIANRLEAKNSMTDEEKAIFYSSWHYLSIQMALTIPGLRSREALSEYFQIPLKRIDVILDFLAKTRLISIEKNKIEVLSYDIHLAKESPHIFRHHSSWRQQAIESLERQDDETELHYSAVVTLSKEDILFLKEQLLAQLRTNIDVIRASREEEVYVYNIDFFKLQKKA